MTTQYINLTQHEAKAAAENRLGMLIRPFDKQPVYVHNWEAPRRQKEGDLFIGLDILPTGDQRNLVFGISLGPGVTRCLGERNFCDELSPVGPPGTVLHCREEWGDPWHHAQPKCFYKATDFDKVDGHPDFDGWKPASEMPDEFIRCRRTGGPVRCKRVKDVTEEEWEASGLDLQQVKGHGLVYTDPATPYVRTTLDALMAAEWLLDSIHGPGSWEANPWLFLATLTND